MGTPLRRKWHVATVFITSLAGFYALFELEFLPTNDVHIFTGLRKWYRQVAPWKTPKPTEQLG